MLRLLFIVATLLLLSVPTQALTETEVSALESLLQTWPSLGTLSTPWVAGNLSRACSKPILSGLACSMGPDPHVLGLYAILLEQCCSVPLIVH